MNNMDKLRFLQAAFPNRVNLVNRSPTFETGVQDGKKMLVITYCVELHVAGFVVPIEGGTEGAADKAIDIAWHHFFGDKKPDSIELPENLLEAI